MEENLFGNSEKNAHPGFDALSEAEFKERRVVFMGDTPDPAPAPDASPKTEAETPEAQAERQAAEAADTKKIEDGKAYLISRAPGVATIADKLDIKPDGVQGNPVDSVKASYRNIEVTVDKDTTDEQLGKLRSYVTKLMGQFKDFVFRTGSVMDLKGETLTLKIDMKKTVVKGFPDTLTISLAKDIITAYELDVAPPIAEDSEFATYLNENLIGKALDDLTPALMKEISDQAERLGVFAGIPADDGAGPATATVEDPETGTSEPLPLTALFGALNSGNIDNLKGKTILIPQGGDRPISCTIQNEGIRFISKTTTIEFTTERGKMTMKKKGGGYELSAVSANGEPQVMTYNSKGELTKFVQGDLEIKFEDGKPVSSGNETADNVMGKGKELFGSFDNFVAQFRELIELLIVYLAPEPTDDEAGHAKTIMYFSLRSGIGLKNKQLLSQVTVEELLNADKGDDDLVGTLSALSDLGFDVTEPKGAALIEMIDHFHKAEDNPAANFEENKTLPIQEALLDMNMIDRKGGYKTPRKRAPEPEAEASSQEALRTAVKSALQNNEAMTELMYKDDKTDRDRLADSLLSLGVVKGEDVTAFKSNDSTGAALRILLKTMSEAVKEEFFGSKDFDIDNAWPQPADMEKIKASLLAKDPGKTDANEIADYVASTGLTIADKTIKIDGSKKSAFATQINVPIRMIETETKDAKLDSSDTKFAAFATSIGMTPEDLVTVMKWLHNPESGQYDGEKITLSEIYAIPEDKAYTLADVIHVVFIEAAAK